MQDAVDNASEPVVIQHAKVPQQLPEVNRGASEWTMDDFNSEVDAVPVSFAVHGGVEVDVEDSSFRI